MVNIGEILGGLWNAFAPFVGKAIIAIVIIGVLGIGIDLTVHAMKKHKNKERE